MTRDLVKLLCAGLLLAGSGFSAQAESWFVGGGLIGVSFEDDLHRVDSGSGITFSGGYQFDKLLSAEILAGLSAHDEGAFDDDVVQFSILAGIKLSVDGEKFRPYGSLGVSLNSTQFGDLDDLDDDEDFDDFDEINGFGLYAGFGADIFVARRHAINIGYRVNSWDGNGDNIDLDVRTDTFSATYNYYFSR